MSAPSFSEHTRRSREVMPWGSGTISKAPRFEPEEPAAIVRGAGCRVFSDDGREFIDFRNGLGPVTLGHSHPAVNEAIRAQLESGIVFGQPHPLECEVAEALRDCVPCAEQVRFLKTGGEAIAACIRLARAATGRQHVIQVGYNGWLSVLAAIGQVLPGRPAEGVPAGVPECLSRLHHASPWADAAALEALFEQCEGEGGVAAVVVAAGYAEMDAGRAYSPAVRKLCDERGAVLIFDEIVTGFRLAMGGAGEYFGVRPDLAVFAKGIANGMPLAAYLGRRELMRQIEGPVSISSTYAGETLSLAACRAVIETYRREDVIAGLWRRGRQWQEGADAIFAARGLPMRLRGAAVCPQIVFDAAAEAPAGLAEAFFRAAWRNGLSLYTVTYVNHAHTAAEIAEALSRLDAACGEIAS